MGTYTQPSQILDTSFGDFQKAADAAFDKEQAKIAARQKNLQAMAAKVLKERNKKLALSEKRKGEAATNVADTKNAIKGYAPLTTNMGLKIYHEDGKTDVTQITAENWDKRGKLIENYNLYSTPSNQGSVGSTGGVITQGNRNLLPGFKEDATGETYTYIGDDLSTPNVKEEGYKIVFSKDDIDWLEHAMVKENHEAKFNRRIKGGTPEIVNDRETDMHITDWYASYKDRFKNKGNLALGVDGSMEAEIEFQGMIMANYDKSSQTYQNARLTLETTKNEVPEFIGMLGNLKDVQNSVLRTDGTLKSTDQVDGIKYDLGSESEEEIKNFELRTNFVLDWGKENTGHRFSMRLSPNGPTMVYYNPHVSDQEFIVTKKDIQNWTENQGNMGIYQLNKDAFDVINNSFDKLQGTNKPTLQKSSNSYLVMRDGKQVQITQQEASLDFTKTNERTLSNIQNFVYDKERLVGSRFGSQGIYSAGDTQNMWQLTGGPKYNNGELGLSWIDISKCADDKCKEKARRQQDYIVTYYQDKYNKENYSTLSNTNFKELKKEGVAKESDLWVNGEAKVTLDDTTLNSFGFKRDGAGTSEYSIEEIAGKYDKLKITDGSGVNGIAELLNSISAVEVAGTTQSALVYQTAKQVNDTWAGVEGWEDVPSEDAQGADSSYKNSK